MDKNTITGLVLMALVFFGFMWLQPKNDDRQAEQAIEQADKNAAAADAAAEPFTATELDWLKKNIASIGTDVRLADSTHAVRYADQSVDLTLAADSLSGTVTLDGKAYPWSEIISPAPKAMTVAQQQMALDIVRGLSNSMGRYGKFASFLKGDDSNTTLQNDVISLDISAKSGSITRAMLKKYDTEYNPDETAKTKEPVVLFDGDSNSFSFDLPLPQPVNTADLYFTPIERTDSSVVMALQFAPDVYWGVRYTLPKGDSYMVRVEVVQSKMQQVAQSNNRTLGFNWHQNIRRQEKGRMFEERNSGLYYKFAGGSVEHLSESKNDTEERQAKIRWIGFKNQFFSSVMISDRPFTMADFNSETLKGSDYLKSVTASARLNDYDWNASTPAQFSLFLGPNLYPLLSDIDHQTKTIDEDLKLTKLIPLGWSIFRWINTIIVIPIFNFLGKYIANYGIIILLLTIFIKLVLFPLTYKSYKSQAKMRILAPDIKAINDKYPGNENAMVRQQKTMALYSKAGASPFSGCLPMLLQMPILFAMFSFFPSCIELRGQSFLWAHDLSAPDAIISWSGNIPLVTEYFGNHISLFCILMTVVNIIYTHINMQNQPGQMPGMKWMMYLMPVMFLVFFNNYAAGLSYYYFLSLLITIVQTYAFRHIIKEEDVRKAMAEAAKKPRKKSGFMARLEEMQKQQEQMLREQRKQNAKKH